MERAFYVAEESSRADDEISAQAMRILFEMISVQGIIDTHDDLLFRRVLHTYLLRP